MKTGVLGVLFGFLFVTLTFFSFSARAEDAVYDGGFTTPRCTGGQSPCAVPALFNGRDTITGGAEPNQPNDLAASPCPDGTAGTYHSDESIDSYTLTDLSGPWFQPGDTVRISVTAYCFDVNDALYVYNAADAAAPAWVYKGAAVCPGGGIWPLTVTFNLETAVGSHAVRAALDYGAGPNPCNAGGFGDRDDLVLAVVLDTDGDGLDNNLEYRIGTDPNDADSDNDLRDDGYEYNNGSDPLSGSLYPTFRRLGGEVQPLASGQGSYQPDVAWTGSEFGLAWEEAQDGNREIYFARVSAAGDTVGLARRITFQAADSNYPSLAWTGSQFGLAWGDARDGNSEIYFGRLAADGATVGPFTRVSFNALYSNNPSLQWTGTEFGVAWRQSVAGGGDVYFARVSAAGAKIGGDLDVTALYVNNYFPSLAFTGSEFGVAYETLVSGQYEMFFARVSVAGSPVGAEARITNAAQNSQEAALTWSGSEYGLAWNDYRDGAGTSEIYFNRLSAAGAPVGADRRITRDPQTSAGQDLMFTGSEYLLGFHYGQSGTAQIYLEKLTAVGDTVAPKYQATGAFDNRLYPSLAWAGNKLGLAWYGPNGSPYQLFFGVFAFDADGDGLSPDAESAAGTNPNDWDTDNDRMIDGWEAAYSSCVNPLVGDSQSDPDLDTLINIDEFLAGTLPCDPDTDNDALPDGDEITLYLTDPLDPDSDGDGLGDGDEVIVYGTDPNDPDTDNDGLGDGDEVTIHLTDPLDPDTDNDGAPDGQEITQGADPFNPAITPGVVKYGADVRVSSNVTNSYSPAIAAAGPDFGLAWSDDRVGNYELYFLRLSGAGSPLTAETRITSNFYSSNTAFLAWNGSEYGLAWNDNRDDPSYAEIYFTRVSQTGAKIGADLRMTNLANTSSYPNLAWIGTEYGLAWNDRVSGDFEIYFTRLTNAGAKIGGDLRLTNSPDVSFNPLLAWSGSEYGLGWQDRRDGDYEIFFTRLGQAGDTVSPESKITANADTSWDQALAFGGGNYALVWSDFLAGNYDLYANLISAAGNTLGPNRALVTGPASATEPEIIWTGTEFGMVFTDNRDNAEIYFARLGQNGDAIGPEQRVTFNAGSSGSSKIAWNGLSFGVTWVDNRDGNPEIYFTLLGYDDDGDGLANLVEPGHLTDPNDWDSDNDLISDGDEVLIYFTNPNDADSDNDNLSDSYEINVSQTNPLNADIDGDGLQDDLEVWYFGTNPFVADSDGDGLDDFEETIIYGTDPWLVDSDGDGIEDWTEIVITLTDPLDPDSNDNGVPDGLEAGSTVSDRDGDGLPTVYEKTLACLMGNTADAGADPDSDGLTNLAEYTAGTNPCAADTDGDGLTDGYEINTSGTNPAIPDTDGDGLQDGAEINTHSTNPLDPDSDNDGFSDGNEIAQGSDPNQNTSFPAPPSRLVNYQGRLADSAGLSLGDTTVSMTFSIFDGATGGAPLWSETQTVTVRQGIYNTLLGSVSPFQASVFSATLRYLEISVNGEPLSPRTLITSVPFAVKAEELQSGRLEMDTRSITINSPSSLTLHVSFNRAFNQPPQVIVGFGGVLGYWFTSSITSEGFDLTFKAHEGGGVGTFTYQAFGN